ncbi:MAG: hypothetical protein M4579_001395 [Chaenotheca gracillima]|nr:MAG: hypothetical protein M4579_001395 [Chaenotheca gracillima]
MEGTAREAIDEDEISGAAVPSNGSNGATVEETRRNAFSELMGRKAKVQPGQLKQLKSSSELFLGRDGLGAYVKAPGSFSPERVIYHNEKWVVLNDLYPKSSVHVLLLPRDSNRNKLHPFEAFEDPVFLADVKAEVNKLRLLVAKELRRRYGQFSAQDQAYGQVIEGHPPPKELPLGRDWEKSVISGIHAHPSMNHLHVHVLAVDRFSPCMKKKKHYNSFATPFLIDVEDFPLKPDDLRRHPGRQGYLDADLKCWRCGKGFKNRFGRFKEHLAEEYEAWKKE